jgi:hypothetical protein
VGRIFQVFNEKLVEKGFDEGFECDGGGRKRIEMLLRRGIFVV